MQRLAWSLGNRVGDSKKHSPFVYDMFYLSIMSAKQMGYRTVFYGTHESVNIIGKWVDEVYDVTNKVPYLLYDDIKTYIWYTDPTAITIDADVFLFKKISFRNADEITDTSLSDSTDLSQIGWYTREDTNRRTPINLRCEEFAWAPPKGKILNALKHFNSLNPKSVIPEWDYNTASSLNTGIISWNGNDSFRKYYCESYVKLREWYFNNEEKLTSLNPLLHRDDLVLSHFVCERLLFNLVKHYNIKFDSLTTNVNNHYIHLKGGNKFKDKEFIVSVKNLVDYHKSNSGIIQDVHNKLVSVGKVKPFLSIRDKRR